MNESSVAKRAVFLDRDGVLNDSRVIEGKPYPPEDAEHMSIAVDAGDALKLLRDQGFILICVTNQPDVARGRRTLDNVQAMNEKVLNALSLDALYTCLHDNADNCSCRKPKPGMLFEGANNFEVDLSQSFMIGDRAGDILAGQAAGCRTIFLDHNYEEDSPEPPADFNCSTLAEASKWIVSHL